MNSNLLMRRVAEVIDKNHLDKQLASGRKLRVKLGIDPSKPDLHIGHAVTLTKLREFQDAGHKAVLIIGDYTAQLGDPTDRSEARKILSPEEVKHNAEGYLEQAFMILNDTQTEVRYQSEWFGTFSLRDTIELMATASLNHLLSHETFQKRLDEGTALSFHELLYPLLQGYDSAMVKSDVEIGGIDQKFNILMGRVVQRSLNMPEQDVVLLKYLPGTDGQAKMSKTLSNTINLTDSPDTMFGKVMSIPDTLIIPYFELATRLDEPSIESWAQQLKNGQIHPKEAKIKLAKQLVGEYYSLTLPPQEYNLVELLTARTTLVPSKSEARRLILQGGVRKNQTAITEVDATVSPKDGEEVVIQVGPRRWLKVAWQK